MNRHLALAFGIAMTVAGCSGSSGTSTQSPTTPTQQFPVTTEMFTGIVPVGGADSHNFNIAYNNGQVTFTLTAAGPPATITMGLGIGSPSGTTCSVSSANAVLAQAGPAAQLIGTANAGAYCVSVFDVGNQAADVNYAVTVTHY